MTQENKQLIQGIAIIIFIGFLIYQLGRNIYLSFLEDEIVITTEGELLYCKAISGRNKCYEKGCYPLKLIHGEWNYQNKCGEWSPVPIDVDYGDVDYDPYPR